MTEKETEITEGIKKEREGEKKEREKEGKKEKKKDREWYSDGERTKREI